MNFICVQLWILGSPVYFLPMLTDLLSPTAMLPTIYPTINCNYICSQSIGEYIHHCKYINVILLELLLTCRDAGAVLDHMELDWLPDELITTRYSFDNG